MVLTQVIPVDKCSSGDDIKWAGRFCLPTAYPPIINPMRSAAEGPGTALAKCVRYLTLERDIVEFAHRYKGMLALSYETAIASLSSSVF